LDSVPDHLTVLVDNHVNDLALLILDEGLTEVSQGLTTGDTEEHALHSHGFVTVVNGTSNKRDVEATAILVLDKRLVLCLGTVHGDLGLHRSELVGLVGNKGEHIAVVDELVDGKLHIVDDTRLARYELLLLNDVLFHAVEKELDCDASFLGHFANFFFLNH